MQSSQQKSKNKNSNSNSVSNLPRRSSKLSPPRQENNSTLPSESSVSERIQLTSSLHDQILRKPISFIILGKYFSDVCQSISLKKSVDSSLLKKVDTMKEVLKDCLSAMPDMNLEVYIMMSTSLKDIQSLKESQDSGVLSSLTKKLTNIASLIEDNRLRNPAKPSAKYDLTEDEPEDLGKEVEVRMSRITVRNLNIWKRILNTQREAEIICYSFLLLYSEVDKTIKLSPEINSNFDKPTDIMRSYINNPGHVVTIVRNTREYIDMEMISLPTIKRIFSYLELVTIERIRSMDKTMTGYVLYELVFYAIMYYSFRYKQIHKVDIFDKKVHWKRFKNNKKISNEELQIVEEEFLKNEESDNKKGIARSASQPANKVLKSEEKQKKSELFVLKEKPKKKAKKDKKKMLQDNPSKELKLNLSNTNKSPINVQQLSPKRKN